MEIVEIVALSHFEDSRVGSVSRKQRMKVPRPIAEQLRDLELVDILDPKPQAASSAAPVSTEVADLGQAAHYSLPPAVQVLADAIATTRRRGRPKAG